MFRPHHSPGLARPRQLLRQLVLLQRLQGGRDNLGKGFGGGESSLSLYMYEGVAASNHRVPNRIPPADPNSMEGYLAEVGEPFLFLDLLHADFLTAPTWLYSYIMTRSEGSGRVFMVPRDQYDGVLLIRRVSPPAYVPGWW